MGEHGQGGPAVAGGPTSDLVLVGSGEGLCRFGRILRCASVVRQRSPGCATWPAVRCSSAGTRVRRFVVAADQQMVLAGVGVVLGVQLDPGP